MRSLLAAPALVLAAHTPFGSPTIPVTSAASRAGQGAVARVTDLPLAVPEHYRRAAGRRVGDTLVVTVETRRARWRPQGTGRVGVTSAALRQHSQ